MKNLGNLKCNNIKIICIKMNRDKIGTQTCYVHQHTFVGTLMSPNSPTIHFQNTNYTVGLGVGITLSTHAQTTIVPLLCCSARVLPALYDLLYMYRT